MDVLHCIRNIVVLISFIQLGLTTISDNYLLNIAATCTRTEDSVPSEWFEVHASNPSPLHELSVELNESPAVLKIKWTINIDGSIHSLTGTWIELIYPINRRYRCQYQPPFTSEQNILTGLPKLQFSFSVSDVLVNPTTTYNVNAYNIPLPPNGTGDKYVKTSSCVTPGCELMSNHPLCSTPNVWDVDISSVLYKDEILVTFSTSLASKRYTIWLRKGTVNINKTEINMKEREEKLTVKLKYTGTCEDLTLSITPHFKHCDPCDSAKHEVSCTNRTGLIIGVGCGLSVLMLLCCCIICKMFGLHYGTVLEDSVSVRVLMVYPALDSVFQQAVMVLAEFLQSHGGISIVIDMWERGNLAEQGPLRWLNTQADLTERVLIILPPQHAHTDCLKANLKPVTNRTVSASANNLFALALNLVTSTAHSRDKFWVVHLNQNKDKRRTPVELRSCRTFFLPGDLEKLHQKLSNGLKLKNSVQKRWFRSLNFNDASWKVKEALQKLEINTNLPPCAEVVCHTELNSLGDSPT